MRLSVQCLNSDAHWMVPKEKRVDYPFRMALQGAPLRLRHYPPDDDPTDFYLVVLQRLTPYFDGEGGEFRCKTNSYTYTVSDVDGQEIVSWHWHPDTYPATHLHVAALDKRTHLPTGRVTFESVVRFLIDELSVDPAREDWEAVLAQQETTHLEYRSWP